MRTLPTALLATVLAFGVAPLSAAPAAAATDWRQAACQAEARRQAPISGPFTVLATAVTPLKPLTGVSVVADRLDFSGVTCELLYVRGALPAGTDVTEASYSHAAYFDLVVGGVQQDEMPGGFAGGSSNGLPGERAAGMPRHARLINVATFRGVETGVVPHEQGVPTEWKGKDYTLTHTRSDWTFELGGSRLVKKTFKVTPATKVAAGRQLTRQLRDARTQAQRREARKTFRLAMRGKKLVVRKLDVELTGSSAR